jgi:sugar phosphate isomerase/epimerase
MKISLCNEVIREMDFAAQCQYASDLGYDGLEVAPFTLSDNPHQISTMRRAELRRMAEDAGITITSLHWLLLTPEGLSLTTSDRAVRQKTQDVMCGLVELCSDLGGKTLIHGSPKQRLMDENEDRAQVELRAEKIFSSVARAAEEADVTYCIEPLGPAETNFINTLSEAAEFVDRVGNPHFRSMLDTKAVASGESEPPEVLVNRWLPKELIAHVHVNDRNLRGPGQGEDQFLPLFSTLVDYDYQGIVSVEPFDYFPDPKSASARAIGYIRGLLEAVR